jgi:hypothetical protein
MTTQERAFTAYYASMTDAELVRTAANKASFVDIAQRLLTEELARRNLQIATGTDAGKPVPPADERTSPLARLLGRLHRTTSH